MTGTAGCRRNQLIPEPDSITVLYPEDTAVLGPDDDQAAQFLMFLPLVSYNTHGEVEGRLAERWQHSPDDRTWDDPPPRWHPVARWGAGHVARYQVHPGPRRLRGAVPESRGTV